ncbi:hypothetical protein HN51_000332 [Arachis hypogaea]
MSAKIIDYMVDEHNIDIDPELLKKVKKMITSSCDSSTQNIGKGNQFLYDIVANGRNGINVDKYIFFCLSFSS